MRMEPEAINLQWPEYLVFVFTLSISAVIGIYYGFFGTKQKSTAEYLLANREMSAWPVSMSLVCSAVSAITILANPVETYLYGAPALWMIFSYIPFSLSLAYLYLPVYFRLQVNSAYEYIELRFDRSVRTVVSLIAVVQLIVSMAIAVYAPSLAINQVTGISTRLSTAVIYLVCVFYSALGGLKAVLWTDVFQAFVMLVSVMVTIIIGLVDVGGIGAVWNEATDGGRLEFFNFDTDSRTRHTFWTDIIGGYFFMLPTYAATQIQIQRFLSMPNIGEARKSLVLNAIGLAVVVGLSYLTGFVVFARYSHCDPISNKEVTKSDQLLPFFVTDSVGDIPGLIGLFVAGITCASMSTLSSGLTALTSIATYDYINKFFPRLSDSKLSFISKINCLLLGTISYAFIFVIEQMGDILPATSAILGIFVGPILGLFSLGMFFPPANAKGSLIGMILSIMLMLVFVIGNQVASNRGLLPDQRLSLRTDACPDLSPNITTTTEVSSTLFGEWEEATNWKDNDDTLLVKFLSTSYLWYTCMGTILSVFLGLLMSIFLKFLSKGEEAIKVKREHLSPPLVSLWERICPQLLDSWVDSASDLTQDCQEKIESG